MVENPVVVSQSGGTFEKGSLLARHARPHRKDLSLRGGVILSVLLSGYS